MRIIEIYSLNKLRTNGEKLYSLTGLTVPDTEAVADEINLLLNRFTLVCRREEEPLHTRGSVPCGRHEVACLAVPRSRV